MILLTVSFGDVSVLLKLYCYDDESQHTIALSVINQQI